MNFLKLLFFLASLSFANIYPTFKINGKGATDNTELYLHVDELQKYKASFNNNMPLLNNQKLEAGLYLYVMDANGEIYLAKSSQVNKHSYFFSGGNIAAGGLLYIDKNGDIQNVDNASGHYHPDDKSLYSLAVELKKRGLDISKIEFIVHRKPTWKYSQALDDIQKLGRNEAHNADCYRALIQ